MPSRIEKFEGGGGRIIHFNRRRNHQPKCFYCDKQSTHNCDFEESGRICSRYLCPDHRNFVAANIDYCPPHMELHRQRIKSARSA